MKPLLQAQGTSDAGEIRSTPQAIHQINSSNAGGLRHHETGSRVLALETISTVDIPSPIYLSAAQGPFVWDADGNQYLDMVMGFGAHVLGHRPASVEAALARQVETGWHYGLTNTTQAAFAEELLGTVPHLDKVLFAGSGTEATMYAIRAARAFTGRDKIVVFDGNYHGSHDYALIKADPMSSRDAPRPIIAGHGVPEPIREQTMLIAPYLNKSAFDFIRAHGNEIAGVLVQPVQNNLPTFSGGWFLEGLREICDEIGALLVFDEVVTGFRLALGGAQERFGVQADLSTYGKSVGGGLPIGVLAGKGDVMQRFALSPSDGGVFSSGTFNANPLSVTAGLAAMQQMKKEAATLYPYLEEQGNRLSAEVNSFCKQHEIVLQLMNAGSMICIHFQRGPLASSRDFQPTKKSSTDAFYYQLLARGVLVPGNRLVFLSSAHESGHVDTIIEAIKSSLLVLRQEGLI